MSDAEYKRRLREQIADALGVAPEDVRGSVRAACKRAERIGAPVYWGMIRASVLDSKFN